RARPSSAGSFCRFLPITLVGGGASRRQRPPQPPVAARFEFLCSLRPQAAPHPLARDPAAEPGSPLPRPFDVRAATRTSDGPGLVQARDLTPEVDIVSHSHIPVRHLIK